MTDRKLTATDWQRDTYLKGFAGMRSNIPVDWRQLESRARSSMSPEAFAYIAGGAGNEETMRSNRNGFAEYQIVPRVLRDVAERSTEIELFGMRLPSPILLSPIGVLEM